MEERIFTHRGKDDQNALSSRAILKTFEIYQNKGVYQLMPRMGAMSTMSAIIVNGHLFWASKLNGRKAMTLQY